MVRRAGNSRSGGADLKKSVRTDAQKLDDLRVSLLRIETLTEGLDRHQFLADLAIQEAVAFRVMAIGDAAGDVSKRTQNAYPDVKWRRIASFRHYPAHEYHDFRPENLWVFIQEVLPGLERKLRRIRPAPAETE